jgi:hypothetical protein
MPDAWELHTQRKSNLHHVRSREGRTHLPSACRSRPTSRRACRWRRRQRRRPLPRPSSPLPPSCGVWPRAQAAWHQGSLAGESRGVTEIRDESRTEAGDGGGSLPRHGRDGERKVPAVWLGMRIKGMRSVPAASGEERRGCRGSGMLGRRNERSNRGGARREQLPLGCKTKRPEA